jgi:hypothetical protein
MAARDFLQGAVIAGGLAYFLDPDRGARRRARARERVMRLAGRVEREIGAGTRDLEHRLVGALHEAGERWRHEDVNVPLPVLEARVRSALGRVCSHPHELDVIAREGGVIELSGEIEDNHADEIVAAVRRVRGVRAVDDDLKRFPADAVAEEETLPERGLGPSLAQIPAARLGIGLAVSSLITLAFPRLSLRLFGALGAAVAARHAAQRRSGRLARRAEAKRERRERIEAPSEQPASGAV